MGHVAKSITAHAEGRWDGHFRDYFQLFYALSTCFQLNIHVAQTFHPAER